VAPERSDRICEIERRLEQIEKKLEIIRPGPVRAHDGKPATIPQDVRDLRERIKVLEGRIAGLEGRGS